MAVDNVLLEVSGLHKSYGDLEVIRGLDLTVHEGEKVVILGRSGSGKSTLLRCINGLEDHQSGRIWFDGEEVSPRSKTILSIRTRIGFVFQSFNLFPHMTALENVSIGLRVVQKLPTADANRRAVDALDQVGLKDKINSRPAELSGGQQQRVGIARALAMDPKLILFDEPTSALDPELINEVLDVILGLARGGRSMILVTHETRFAGHVADRIVFMDAGVILNQGVPTEMLGPAAPPEVRQFLREFEHDV